jgi:hypothetical protein
MAIMSYLAAILAAILDLAKCSRVTKCHPADLRSGYLGDAKKAKTLCKDLRAFLPAPCKIFNMQMAYARSSVFITDATVDLLTNNLKS